MAARPHSAATVIYDPELPPTLPPGMSMGEHRRLHAAERPQGEADYGGSCTCGGLRTTTDRVASGGRSDTGDNR